MNTADILARLEIAYATQYPFKQSTVKDNGDDRRYDVGRQVVELIPLTENIALVIDQPSNFRDAFDYAGAHMFGVRGAAAAALMRKWYSVKVLRVDTMTVETQHWVGGGLNKDMTKAQKQLEKYKASLLKQIAKRGDLANLPSIKI
jgi:hypothetical protein